MALIWMDGFDTYGSHNQRLDAMLGSSLYVRGRCVADNGTRTGRGMAIRFQQAPGNSDEIRKAFPAVDEIIVGFAWKTDEIATLRNICDFYYDNQFGTNRLQCGLWMAGTGAVTFGYYDSGGTSTVRVKLFESHPNVMFPAVWHFVEVRVKLHETEGHVIVRVDGQTVLAGYGRTKNAAAPSLCNIFRTGNGHLEDIVNNVVYLDDLYICDTQGGVYNDFLGDVVVHAVMPHSDAGPNDMAVFGGGLSHASAVSDVPPDNDVSYLYSNTEGHVDMFNVDQLPANIIDVLAVSVHARVKKDAAGTSMMKLKARYDDETDDSPAIPLTTQYVTRSQVYEIAPDGGAWNRVKANNMQVGVEII